MAVKNNSLITCNRNTELDGKLICCCGLVYTTAWFTTSQSGHKVQGSTLFDVIDFKELLFCLF